MEISVTRPSARPRLAFDPVCGSPLPALYGANPYCDGKDTFYFCSAMCRRFFIDQKNAERSLQHVPSPEAGAQNR